MTQYNILIVTLSNSQVNKLKPGIKNATEVTLKISSSVVGDSTVENNLPHKLLLTNAQFSRFRKGFINNSSANIILSKTQLHNMKISRIKRVLEPLLKTGLPFMKNIHKLSS